MYPAEDAIDTVISDHFTAHLMYDTHCENPFVEWDQVGILAGNPNRSFRHISGSGSWREAESAYYRLGIHIADYGSSGYGISWERIPPGFRPQSGYDGDGYPTTDLDDYDAIIYTTRTRAERMHSKTVTPAQIWDALESEARVWRQWMNGECYGVVITDHDGNHADSCWGFLGYDDPLEPAREMLAEAESFYATEQNLLATTGIWVTI